MQKNIQLGPSRKPSYTLLTKDETNLKTSETLEELKREVKIYMMYYNYYRGQWNLKSCRLQNTDSSFKRLQLLNVLYKRYTLFIPQGFNTTIYTLCLGKCNGISNIKCFTFLLSVQFPCYCDRSFTQ